MKTTEQIMESIQEHASTWSLAGGRFDDGTMFDYLYEARAYSISLENAEMRESLLKQELLATQISLENAEADTKRLEWALPLLTGSSGAEDDAKTNALVIQLIAGKDGREAIDGAMAARAAA